MPTGGAYSSGHLVPSLWDLHMFYLLRPILFRTCRYFTGLCSSNIPRYFLDFAMYEAGKLAQVVKETERYKLNILGVSEARWTGANKIRYISGTTVRHSGRSDSEHREVVAILINPIASKALMEWEPVDERLVRARFNSRYCKLTVIVCYAPTNDESDETKDSFYIKLQSDWESTKILHACSDGGFKCQSGSGRFGLAGPTCVLRIAVL